MEDKTSAAPPSNGVQHLDGSIDFVSYSAAQLEELQHCIDGAAFPITYANLVSALRLKTRHPLEPPVSENTFVGRFTLHDGWRGWRLAKRMRSPVFGRGSITVESAGIVLSGFQRTWLGAAAEAHLTLDGAAIRNVMRDQEWVEFEIRRSYRLAARIRFQCASDADAVALVGKLPAVTTPSFVDQWNKSRQFHQTLQALGGRPVITPVIVLLNSAAFVTIAVLARKPGAFTVPQLWSWGANFAPLTVHGQWWRLFTSLFIHLNIAHLLFNMWALWNVGRLSERLFGRGTFVAVYLATGMLASLSSIAWDPSLTSAGASGAIFGVFGAFLALLLRQRKELPSGLFRSHWVSTLVFVLYSLVSGVLQPGVDNAAHVGGLLSGLALGAILARPLNRELRRTVPMARNLLAGVFICTVVLLAVWQVDGIGSNLTGPELYARSHTAYAAGERKNLELWNALGARASTGWISSAELGRRFEQEILPFWTIQKDQLTRDKASTAPIAQRPFALLLSEFVDLRYQWASAVVDAAKNDDPQRLADATALSKKTNTVQAQLDRLSLRARMEHRPRALSASPLAIRAREWLTGYHQRCIEAPTYLSPAVAASDDRMDGPAIRHQIGCEAQHLFMSGDYERLDSLMIVHVVKMEDLPDGSSRFEAVVVGLSNLFDYGNLSADTVFGHTADWRRRTHDSVMAELTEAMAFRAWAWAARGNDAANTVSGQNMAIYGYRTEMAAAALREIADRAVHNPMWYALSIGVGLDQSQTVDQLRSIFESGVTESPGYRPLYRSMLRILLPRWQGSPSLEDQFITEVDSDAFPTRGHERYAELYSDYADFEGDDVDLFQDSSLDWDRMKIGYRGLVRRYPKSDWILNRFANFACRAKDEQEYRGLRGTVGARYSSTAWSDQVTLESCDQKLHVPRQYEVFGGIRLGLTRIELQKVKGAPIRQEPTSWVYNALDQKHNGVLTVHFAPPAEDPRERIKAIEYVGDEKSAPSELPFLADLSSVQVIQRYGAQVSGHLVLTGPMTFAFRNGLYVETRDEKVYGYGIYSPKQ